MTTESALGHVCGRLSPDPGTHKRVINEAVSGLQLTEPQQEADGEEGDAGAGQAGGRPAGGGPGPRGAVGRQSSIQCPKRFCKVVPLSLDQYPDGSIPEQDRRQC